ncbi:MAG: hypothetical protein C4547_11585 [Phycisphaerales bacterium]|nr:MAG: hypothetical protein C4547_11585 [Phycisphaerales bacterium]
MAFHRTWAAPAGSGSAAQPDIRTRHVRSSRVRRLNGWRVPRLESCKVGRFQGWKARAPRLAPRFRLPPLPFCTDGPPLYLYVPGRYSAPAVGSRRPGFGSVFQETGSCGMRTS